MLSPGITHAQDARTEDYRERYPLVPMITPPEARPWDLSLRAFGEWDENVPLVADDATDVDQEGFAIGLLARGVYRFIKRDPWEAGVRLEALFTFYPDDDFNDFNLTSVSPSVYLARDFSLGAMPATAELSYYVYQDWLQSDEFLFSHGPRVQLTVLPMANLEIAAHYRAAIDRFEDDPPGDAARDAMQHGVGIGATYYFNAGRQSVSADYEYVLNDADGDNFVYNAHRVTGQFFTELFGPVALSLQAGYEMQDYSDFTTTPEREMDNTFFRGVVYIALSPSLSIDIYAAHAIYDSNLPAFEAERTTFGAGVTYRF